VPLMLRDAAQARLRSLQKLACAARLLSMKAREGAAAAPPRIALRSMRATVADPGPPQIGTVPVLQRTAGRVPSESAAVLAAVRCAPGQAAQAAALKSPICASCARLKAGRAVQRSI
jgi:hypothetical protein